MVIIMNRNNEKSPQMDEKAKIMKQTAIALSYNENDIAPKIIASGHEYLAEKIVASAKESNISIHKDEKLANTLSKIEIGQYIPSELYEVVAEVLLFVDNLDRIKHKVLPEKYPKK